MRLTGQGDPLEVTIDFSHTHLWDHASVTGIERVVEKYEQFGESVTLIGLNSESEALLRKSGQALSA